MGLLMTPNKRASGSGCHDCALLLLNLLHLLLAALVYALERSSVTGVPRMVSTSALFPSQLGHLCVIFCLALKCYGHCVV